MRKILSGVIACIAIVGCLAGLSGCAGADRYVQIIESVKLPDVYYIEYEITGEDGTVTTLAKGIDAKGNIYYRNADAEYIFAVDGKNYKTYGKSSGAWAEASETVNGHYVDELTKDFKKDVEKSREQFLGSYKKSGEKTFLDRSCDVYSLELKIVNFTQDYELVVDRDTGVCMSFYGTSSVNSKETQKSGFECVSYRTEDLDFSSWLAGA